MAPCRVRRIKMKPEDFDLMTKRQRGDGRGRRRVGRAVECTGLENRQGCKLLVSSNLTPSAMHGLPPAMGMGPDDALGAWFPRHDAQETREREHPPNIDRIGRSRVIGLLMVRHLVIVAFMGLAFALPAFAAKKQEVQRRPAAQAAPEVVDADPESSAPQSADKSEAKGSAKVTGTFSTLRSVGGDDDMVGLEVIIVRSREGLRAFVQTADGVLAAPVLVPVTADGATLRFSIPSMGGEALEFKGKATRQGLTGTLDERPLTLPRRRSYWQ